MIYLDSSVALAYLFAEDRTPGETLWRQTLVASRLLEYEVWNRLNARKLERSYGDSARALLNRIAFIELTPEVLARALDPFPVAVKTLDALHLASIEYLRGLRRDAELASYDDRLIAAAQAMKVPIAAL